MPEPWTFLDVMSIQVLSLEPWQPSWMRQDPVLRLERPFPVGTMLKCEGEQGMRLLDAGVHSI